MDEIIQRLRSAQPHTNFGSTICAADAWAAGDEIESLRAENARLTEERDALVTVAEIFVGHGRALGAYGRDPGAFWVYTDKGYREIPASDFVFSRDALAKVKGGPDAR